MKRIIVLASLMMLVTTSAYAFNPSGTIGNGAAITGDSKPLGKLSTNVSLSIMFNDVAFSAATKHLSGNRAFGTSSTDTRIYYMEVDPGKDMSTSGITLTSSDSTDFQAAGWSGL